MRVIFSHHALLRMKERKISKQDVYKTLLQPLAVEKDKNSNNRFVAKRIYHSTITTTNQLLLVFYEVDGEEVEILLVITVVSTSKIDKYL